jgi:4-amino-4-deoxy-L-arabinose transferase-like glycosyltransferase
LLILGGALRVGWVVRAGASPHFLGDPEAYLLQGEMIATGHGYTNPLIPIDNRIRAERHEPPLPEQPAAFYPPGYPVFVGGVVWVVWHTPIPDTAVVASVEMVQALLGILSILLVYLLARRAFGDGAGLTAAAITALYPNLITTTATLQLESVFVVLSLATLVVLQPAASGADRGIRRLLAGGMLLGAVALVRPTVGLLLFAMLATWLLARRPAREIVVGFATLALAMVAVVAPWTVRNALDLHAFVPVSTGIGPALCMSRNPEATGALSIPILQRECQPQQTPPGQSAAQADVAVNQYATHHAISWVVHHPRTEVSMWFTRMHRAYAHNTSGLDDYRSHMSAGAYRVVARVSDIASYLVIALAVVGAIATARRRRPDAVFLVGSAIAFAVVPAILFGDPRYRVPADPLFVILAAAALGALVSAARRPRLTTPA